MIKKIEKYIYEKTDHPGKALKVLMERRQKLSCLRITVAHLSFPRLHAPGSKLYAL